jgi:hypothetical protein
MISPDSVTTPGPIVIPDHRPVSVPFGLPADAVCVSRPLSTGEYVEVLSLPLEETAAPWPPATDGGPGGLEDTIRRWVSAAASPAATVVVVPLYGCHVAWTAGRAAVIGPPERLGQLEAAVVEFAGVEADLRDAERRAAALLETVEGDVATSLSLDEHSPDRCAELADRHRRAVAVGRRLALLAPLVHTPPLHPPTLASQLGERLRERTRLVERLEFATQRAEFAERVAEACGQRALEAGIGRRQLGLEWAIVVLLVVQTALLVVELLSHRVTP